MDLQYLLFDASDEESGSASFDAMAAVQADRLPALLAEVTAVLCWAHRAFGAAGARDDQSDWDFDLQADAGPAGPLAIAYDTVAGAVSLAAAPAGTLTTVTLTVSGSPAFCDLFRERFPAGH